MYSWEVKKRDENISVLKPDWLINLGISCRAVALLSGTGFVPSLVQDTVSARASRSGYVGDQEETAMFR